MQIKCIKILKSEKPYVQKKAQMQKKIYKKGVGVL